MGFFIIHSWSLMANQSFSGGKLCKKSQGLATFSHQPLDIFGAPGPTRTGGTRIRNLLRKFYICNNINRITGNMPDSVLMCLMKNCPIYAAFFSADKKSTTESTTENGPQTRNYFNKKIMFWSSFFVRRFGKRNRVTLTWETINYATKNFILVG
jgi:hypothetical protein